MGFEDGLYTLSLAIGPKSLLIVGAVGTYVLGFLFKDQIYTRILVCIGSVLYILYYATVGPTPLWDAIAGSTMIALASLQGVLRLWWSRLRWAIPRGSMDVYQRIGQIEPGLFRQLYKASEKISANEDMQLTRQNQPVERLWYFVEGVLRVEREGQLPAFIERAGFVGEIAWISEDQASATVTAEKGSRLLCWPAKNLRRATRKSARLELALESLIAQDLAQKLSQSHPIDMRQPVAVPPPEPTIDLVAHR